MDKWYGATAQRRAAQYTVEPRTSDELIIRGYFGEEADQEVEAVEHSPVRAAEPPPPPAAPAAASPCRSTEAKRNCQVTAAVKESAATEAPAQARTTEQGPGQETANPECGRKLETNRDEGEEQKSCRRLDNTDQRVPPSADEDYERWRRHRQYEDERRRQYEEEQRKYYEYQRWQHEIQKRQYEEYLRRQYGEGRRNQCEGGPTNQKVDDPNIQNNEYSKRPDEGEHQGQPEKSHRSQCEGGPGGQNDDERRRQFEEDRRRHFEAEQRRHYEYQRGQYEIQKRQYDEYRKRQYEEGRRNQCGGGPTSQKVDDPKMQDDEHSKRPDKEECQWKTEKDQKSQCSGCPDGQNDDDRKRQYEEQQRRQYEEERRRQYEFQKRQYEMQRRQYEEDRKRHEEKYRRRQHDKSGRRRSVLPTRSIQVIGVDGKLTTLMDMRPPPAIHALLEPAGPSPPKRKQSPLLEENFMQSLLRLSPLKTEYFPWKNNAATGEVLQLYDAKEDDIQNKKLGLGMPPLKTLCPTQCDPLPSPPKPDPKSPLKTLQISPVRATRRPPRNIARRLFDKRKSSVPGDESVDDKPTQPIARSSSAARGSPPCAKNQDEPANGAGEAAEPDACPRMESPRRRGMLLNMPVNDMYQLLDTNLKTVTSFVVPVEAGPQICIKTPVHVEIIENVNNSKCRRSGPSVHTNGCSLRNLQDNGLRRQSNQCSQQRDDGSVHDSVDDGSERNNQSLQSSQAECLARLFEEESATRHISRSSQPPRDDQSFEDFEAGLTSKENNQCLRPPQIVLTSPLPQRCPTVGGVGPSKCPIRRRSSIARQSTPASKMPKVVITDWNSASRTTKVVFEDVDYTNLHTTDCDFCKKCESLSRERTMLTTSP